MELDSLIREAIHEDIGDGDHTSMALITPKAQGRARLKIKDHGVIAGLDLAVRIFKMIDPSLKIRMVKKDGDRIVPGDIAFDVRGNIRSILAAERLVLNFMQRLSGIATATALMVEQIKETKAVLLDTRKTTPNLRELEKYAVRMGGGKNHRMGLYDMIMIKDNHVDFAGGIIPAIDLVNKYLLQKNKNLKIEIEVRNFDELADVLHHGHVHRIMLDNFNPVDLRLAVQLINNEFETEASGGITIENVKAYAETGVDFISVGSVTHNFRSLDMSLKAVNEYSIDILE